MAMIKQIDSGSVHRIQSGQVIVDLCSVVKELVENSVDAGATIIDIRFRNQGLDLIEVQDNGCGISPADYNSVALKHHTSKLSSYSDIASLQTFGFRGEALASLCALSTLTLTTCVGENVPKGSKLTFKTSGELQDTSIIAAQRGTIVSVESLFHNLPVRRRELDRNIKREWHKVVALLNQYACIQTNVKFSVTQQPNKGRRVLLFSTNGNTTTRENIINIFGAKTMGALICLDLCLEARAFRSDFGVKSMAQSGSIFASREVLISGHVSKPVPGDGRQTPDRQMFFINGRPCALPQFAKIFNEVYRTYSYSQSPFICADIQLDTSLYDVNVSPDKRSILLHDQNHLLDALRTSLVKLFDAHEYTVPLSHPAGKITQKQALDDRGSPSGDDEKNTERSISAVETKESGPESKLDSAEFCPEPLLRNGSYQHDKALSPTSIMAKAETQLLIRNGTQKHDGVSFSDSQSLDNYKADKHIARSRSQFRNTSVEDSPIISLDRRPTDQTYTSTELGDKRQLLSKDVEIGTSGITTCSTSALGPLPPPQFTSINIHYGTSTTPSQPPDSKGAILTGAPASERQSHESRLGLTTNEISNQDKSKVGEIAELRIRTSGVGRRKDVTSFLLQRFRLQEAAISSFKKHRRSNTLFQGINTLANDFRIPEIGAADAESKLPLIIEKVDFERMRVAGQFNLGFIIAVRPAKHEQNRPEISHDELLIIDQHASDEKYNFERLQNTTAIQSQRLVHPKRLRLTAVEEEIILGNMRAIEANGFSITIDKTGQWPVGSRCQLIALPLSRETAFDVKDLEELICLLADQPAESSYVPRPSKVRKMLAMRACRSSVMIGKALSRSQMNNLLQHMGELDKPWNCPHGRPTMRHLFRLPSWGSGGWKADSDRGSVTAWKQFALLDDYERL